MLHYQAPIQRKSMNRYFEVFFVSPGVVYGCEDSIVVIIGSSLKLSVFRLMTWTAIVTKGL